MEINPREYWSITEGVFNCLIDDERSLAFMKSIQNTVNEGDIVVDMGSGTGILAMTAAQAGAKKVYAVEFDKNNSDYLKETFEINGFDQIEILEGDIRSIELPEKVDVIIGEMIATGLIEEQQIQAMNNMLKYASDGVKVHLKKYTNFIDLVFNNNSYYDFKFPIIRYEYSDEKSLVSDKYTDYEMISHSDFSGIIQDKDRIVDFSKELEIRKKGIINGLRISSETEFYDGTTFGSSFAYSYPIILPINNISVEVGDKVCVTLEYVLCGGFKNLKYTVKK